MDEKPWWEDVSFPVLLRHARTTYGKAMRGALEDAGYDDIPANGLYIIGGLAIEDKHIPLRQLVKELGITKQGAGQLVDSLVMRGYLQRTVDENDRRQLIVALTERGRAAADAQSRAREKIDAALLECVGEADLYATRRTLAVVIGMGHEDEDQAEAAA